MNDFRALNEEILGRAMRDVQSLKAPDNLAQLVPVFAVEVDGQRWQRRGLDYRINVSLIGVRRFP